MKDALASLSPAPRVGQTSLPIVLLVCLLVGIRLMAESISASCFFDLQTPTARTFHIHGVGVHAHCDHGRYKVSPLVDWACSVCKDADGYALPQIPRLPILVSFFVPLFFPVVSFGSRALIVPHGRGPPLLFP